MKTDPETLAEWTSAARERGADAAKAAASWTVDGNTNPEHVRRLLRMLDDGDPEAYDLLPSAPDLSGEWADAPTPTSLALEIVGDIGDRDEIEWAELVDAIAQAFEDGVSETFESACEAELRKAVA